MFHDPETAFGLIGVGLLCVAVLTSRPDSLEAPGATVLPSRAPAPHSERQEDQHHSDCCPKEERVLRAPWSRRNCTTGIRTSTSIAVEDDDGLDLGRFAVAVDASCVLRDGSWRGRK